MRAPLLFVALLTLCPPALALDEQTVQDVLEEVAGGDLAQARTLLEDGGPAAAPDAARRAAILDLVVQVAELEAGRRPRDQVVARLRELAGQADPADLQLLHDAQQALGAARSYLSPLVRASYHAIGPALDAKTLVALARAPERRVRRLAVSALAEQLAPLRARVSAGGCLNQQEQLRMADPALIQLLIERLSDPPPSAVNDQIPADLAVQSRGTATAMQALVLIEAAALPALRDQEEQPLVAATQAAIKAAVTRRLRLFPASTWYCADGQHARAGVAALVHCGEPVPSASRYCPRCGTQVRQVCPTCGELYAKDAPFCPSCGSAPAEAAAHCRRCQAAIPAKSAYCPQCGLDLTHPDDGQ